MILEFEVENYRSIKDSTEPQYFNNLIPLAKAAWAETLNFLLNTSENYRIMIAL